MTDRDLVQKWYWVVKRIHLDASSATVVREVRGMLTAEAKGFGKRGERHGMLREVIAAHGALRAERVADRLI